MIEHGGNRIAIAKAAGCDFSELLDFSVNLHPNGMPDGLFPVCFRALDDLSPYPEAYAESLSICAAHKWNLKPENILFGNGSSELLAFAVRVFPCKRAVIITPGYLEYAENCRRESIPIYEFQLDEADDFELDLAKLDSVLCSSDLVIIGNPNNPTGNTVDVAKLHNFIEEHSNQYFLIDEAFADFSGETLLRRRLLPNLLVVRSMTKFYSIAGLRLGYAVGEAKNIAELQKYQVPWQVGTVAVKAAEFLLKNEPKGDSDITRLRDELATGLLELGLHVYPSYANYLLVKTPRPLTQELLKYRIAVRNCANYSGLSDYFIRIAVRRQEDNLRLLEAMRKILLPSSPAIVIKRKRPALMLQGTCSNAGKSVLTAAFCRILLQDGYAVAPFKAQNMALNSFVTPDGGEIGRAQAVQSEACRLDPDVRMNPILLKPNSDTGSQVILLGKAIGNYQVRDYFAKKKELWHEVTRAYDSLSSDYDCIVLEGAGSPGEINLKSTDLVNMRMAEYAQSPVLLAGDIDRGGVYASFIGTYATLEPWERKLLYGFIVNKFRGDASLLNDAHEYVKRMTGKGVLGVIDYQRDLGLPEEDSVNFGFFRPTSKESKTIDIALIHLGHIANFTDFTPFEVEVDTQIRIVYTASELGEPDILIIPGSKSVATDLESLKANGLFDKITNSNAFIVGICGGLQILGRNLSDPDGVESTRKNIDCMNLLPLQTVMQKQKILRRSSAVCADGTKVQGYEIHHGESICLDKKIAEIIDSEGRPIGWETPEIFATYLHGVFDDDKFRRDFLNRIRHRKGWLPKSQTAKYGMDDALNSLAEHVRNRVNIKDIYKQMGLL